MTHPQGAAGGRAKNTPTIPGFPLRLVPIDDSHRDGAPQLVCDEEGIFYPAFWSGPERGWVWTAHPGATIPAEPVSAIRMEDFRE